MVVSAILGGIVNTVGWLLSGLAVIAGLWAAIFLVLLHVTIGQLTNWLAQSASFLVNQLADPMKPTNVSRPQGFPEPANRHGSPQQSPSAHPGVTATPKSSTRLASSTTP